jgi:hypothetical protein
VTGIPKRQPRKTLRIGDIFEGVSVANARLDKLEFGIRAALNNKRAVQLTDIANGGSLRSWKVTKDFHQYPPKL